MQPGKDTQQLFDCYSSMGLRLIFKTMYVKNIKHDIVYMILVIIVVTCRCTYLHPILKLLITLYRNVPILDRKISVARP